jgi:hypothetical protein
MSFLVQAALAIFLAGAVLTPHPALLCTEESAYGGHSHGSQEWQHKPRPGSP